MGKEEKAKLAQAAESAQLASSARDHLTSRPLPLALEAQPVAPSFGPTDAAASLAQLATWPSSLALSRSRPAHLHLAWPNQRCMHGRPPS